MEMQRRLLMYRKAVRTARTALVLLSGIGTAQQLTTPKEALSQLRFSPDGRYVLAQGAATITIVTVQPFAVLFEIPGQSNEAHFTPDSRYVVLVNSVTRTDPQKIAYSNLPPHVERWSIADHKRAESRVLPALGCRTEALSPDGAFWVCLDFESTLRFVDVKLGSVVLERKQFTQRFRYDPPLETGRQSEFTGELGVANIIFSADGRFVVVTPQRAEGSAVAWDLRNKRPIELTGKLKQLRHFWCAFLDTNRMAVGLGATTKEADRGISNVGLIVFPSGKPILELKIPLGHFFRSSDPSFLLVRPFGGYFWGESASLRSAAVELSTGLVVISDTPALDVFGRFYVAEPAENEVGLYEIGKGLQERVALHTK